jgi:hypothetical protein
MMAGSFARVLTLRLHIQFWLEEEDVDPDVSGVGRDVEIWLQTMNPDHNAGNPVATQFSGAAIPNAETV